MKAAPMQALKRSRSHSKISIFSACKKHVFIVAILAIITGLQGTTPALALSALHGSASSSSLSSSSNWELIQQKIRIRSFSEIMSPGLSSQSGLIPNHQGGNYAPTNWFTILWTDYEIAKNIRLLYWQRAIFMLGSDQNFEQWKLYPRDPRFALRLTQVLNIPNLNTTFDFYIQPGVTQNKLSLGNHYELGFRTSSNYTPSGSRFTFGLIQEFTTAYLDPEGLGPRAYGWLMPMLSYTFNPFVSWQTTSVFNLTNSRKKGVFDWNWDDPKPYMQNGVNLNFTPSTSITLLMNHYLGTRPTLNNTWLSLWISVDFI
ncbi:MAG: hypothetical protein ACO3A2_06345 [Bdellovibrionia bacterium]